MQFLPLKFQRSKVVEIQRVSAITNFNPTSTSAVEV